MSTWTKNPLASALRDFLYVNLDRATARKALEWAEEQDAEVERIAAEVGSEARAALRKAEGQE